MRLYPTLPLIADEMPTSLAARLARLHGLESPYTFTSQMGISPEDLMRGDHTALEALAKLTGASLSELSRNAIVPSGQYLLARGQAVRRKKGRMLPFACARCVAEDLGTTRNAWRIGERLHWALEHLRCCRVHGTMLTSLSVRRRVARMTDLPGLVQLNLSDLLATADSSAPEITSPLEEYLCQRLDGTTGPAWLDALPWFAAARTCEIVGALLIDGSKARLGNCTDEQWVNAGIAGFEAASKGVEGLYAALDRVRIEVDVGGAISETPHLKIWFGRVFTWLSEVRDEGVYDPLRDVLLEIARKNIALSPEDQFFSRRVVETRLLHSVASASAEIGVGIQSLKRRLVAARLIGAHEQTRIAPRILLSVSPALEKFFQRERHSITYPKVAKYLSALPSQTLVLAESGLIKPYPGQKSLHRRDYDKRDLDAFLGKLLAGAVPVEKPEFPQVAISRAVRLLIHPTAEIVQAILDGRVGWKGRDTRKSGYASVLIDFDEIKRLLFATTDDSINFSEAGDMIGACEDTIRKLIRINAIDSPRVQFQGRFYRHAFVSRSSIEEFHRRHIMLSALAKAHGVPPRRLRGQLRDLEIKPVFERCLAGAVFYARAELPPTLESGLTDWSSQHLASAAPA